MAEPTIYERAVGYLARDPYRLPFAGHTRLHNRLVSMNADWMVARYVEAEERRDELAVKAEALHMVVSALAAKANVSTINLIDLLGLAESRIREGIAGGELSPANLPVRTKRNGGGG